MRRVALAIVSTITSLIVLLSFKTHSTLATPAAAVSTPSAGTTGAGNADSAATSSASAKKATAKKATAKKATARAAATSSSASSAAKTVTGDEVETQYGPVQIQITVQNGAITAATAVEYPSNDPRDQEINAYAIPQLNQEAVAAQSAQINMVSGATYTSEGYLNSLQSALDKAGL